MVSGNHRPFDSPRKGRTSPTEFGANTVGKLKGKSATLLHQKYGSDLYRASAYEKCGRQNLSMADEDSMRAWLIKWCWAGDYAAVDHPIVTVLSARTSAREVRRYVEQRYIEKTASLDEMLSYARYNCPQEPPYPAELEQGRIHCGHNPWIEASLVDDLRVEVGADGEEVLEWAKPDPAKV